MASVVYTLANVNGYTTPMGSRALGVRKLSWNTGNYVTGGYAASRQSFGLRGFDTAWAGISAGGHYRVEAQIGSGAGGATVNLRLFVFATGVEVANGVALTADSVTVGAIGG